MKTAARGLAGAAGIVALALVMIATISVVQPDLVEAAGGTDVVAKVGGKSITRGELDKEAFSVTIQDRIKIYETEKKVLNIMIEDDLLEKEAERRGISVDELKEKEMAPGEVGDDDISAWYEQNQARLRGRALDDQLKGQIRNFLTQQKAQEARDTFLAPLKEKAGVRIMLDPPRVDVETARHHPSKGPAAAPVTIVEFTDFQCPFCSRVGPTLEKIQEVYGKKVRIVFRDFPLAFHKDAPKAHEAAACASEQGKFWEYHDKLFGNQRALKMENLKSYAEELGLDTTKFNACLESGKMADRVTENLEAGQGYGVSGTPAFFINGRFLSGAQPYEAFSAVINEELEMKGHELPKSS